jgi:methylated-DNA-[protein]-cysteine S-methyltransferase
MQDHPSSHAAFYTLFEASIGLCGLAWNERGIIGFQLPKTTLPTHAAASPSDSRDR